jgi:class 3 adenylate cyclase
VRPPVDVSLHAQIPLPPADVWAFLADTDRLNRLVDLPSIRFRPPADPEQKGHYRAETHVFGMLVTYEEFPFEWVEPRWYRVLRRFDGGPLEEIEIGVRLTPTAGGTDLETFGRLVPRSWLASLAAKGLGRKAGEDVIRAVREYADRSKPAPLAPGAANDALLEARLDPAKVPGPVERLRRHLREGSDLEVLRMRPFELADRWGEGRQAVLRMFLHAARTGAVDLSWTVLCPTCRVAASRAPALSSLKSKVHCDTCRIDFGADLASSMEARFAVNPAVRRARTETFCIGGPANMPQIAVQLRLGAGETRREPFAPPSGALRARCFQAPGIHPLTGTRLVCATSGFRVEPGEPGVLEVRNELPGEALVVVERETWKESAATAAQVTSLQDFRDLFPAEAVAPGEELGISSLAVLFTDLKGSTDLYRRVGDGRAFAFVQGHFRLLVETAAAHRGGVVKTMGDAIMATFASARDALEAGVDMQRHWEEFRRRRPEGEGMALKVGVHQGPSIAINNGGRLDYFGTTVNLAARVQGKAGGGELVFTRALAEDPEARAWLESERLSPKPFTAALKGLEGEHELYRLSFVEA